MNFIIYEGPSTKEINVSSTVYDLVWRELVFFAKKINIDTLIIDLFDDIFLYNNMCFTRLAKKEGTILKNFIGYELFV